MQFVVLSSSRGTTFRAILDRIADHTLAARCVGLITDRRDRGCVAKAQAAHLPIAIVERRVGESREDYDRRLHEAIQRLIENGRGARSWGVGSNGEKTANGPQPLATSPQPPVLACTGWMWIFSPWFVRQWRGRILNIHPALLPKHPGAHAHEEVLASGERESGMTIHLIDEGVDTGGILLQKSCPVLPGDTVETLKARVQELEKEWYPRVLQMIEQGEMSLPMPDQGKSQ